MEFTMIRWLFEDKEIVNPMNNEEVFTCEDLVQDWKVCRREASMQTVKGLQSQSSCWELRKLAHKCWWSDEDDFLDFLIE